VNRHPNQVSDLESSPSQTDGPASQRRDSVENRERIMEAARNLFAESGIEAVSMHRIAQAAGVGQGTLYRHYTHKGDLCRDLMQESAEHARTQFEAYWAETEGRPALERLNGVIELLVALFEAKLPYFAAIDDACAGEHRTSKFKLPLYRWIHGIISELLNDAQGEGAIPPTDVTFTADAVLAALSPDMYQYQRQERGLSQAQIVQGVRRLYT
jgi:AcrR family transcriptional regulator